MEIRNIQNKLSQNQFLEPINGEDFCEVSKASVEIMLDRFCHGNEIEFPFSQ